jgi:hypothetical protein
MYAFSYAILIYEYVGVAFILAVPVVIVNCNVIEFVELVI